MNETQTEVSPFVKKGPWSFPNPEYSGERKVFKEFEDNEKQKVIYTAIHRRVLVVAVPRFEGTWKAYVVPVPGHNHDKEAKSGSWVHDGEQLWEERARVFFSHLENVPYAR